MSILEDNINKIMNKTTNTAKYQDNRQIGLYIAILQFAILSIFIPNLAFADNQTNLISNPQVETVDSVDNTKPSLWDRGAQWGTEIPVYEYPATNTPSSDITIGKAVAVSFPIYNATTTDGGDAKWMFQSVPVIVDRQYNFNDVYNSNTTSYVTAEFFKADHTHLSFAGFFPIPATQSNEWKTASAIFTAPTDAAYITVFHTIQSQGKLITDNYNLFEVPPPVPFKQGFVTLTFDDGYIDHITNAKTILDNAGVKGTFYIVSHVSGFSISNSSVETVDPIDSNRPFAWSANTPSGSSSLYPVLGHSGNRAVQINSTIDNTDASWNFAQVSVLADENYTYSEYYKSNTSSDIYVKIITNTGTTEYIDNNGAVTSTLTPFVQDLASTTDWTKFEGNFYLPPETKYVSVYHAITGTGSLTIDDVTLGAYNDFATADQIISLKNDGHEIGGHTQTHANLTSATNSEANNEIASGRLDLVFGGINPVISFAYPYGNFNDQVKTIVHDAGYTSGRSVLEGLNGTNSDKYALLVHSVNKDTTVAQVKTWIDQAISQKKWLILVYHQIQEDLTDPNLLYGSKPSDLIQVLDYIKSVNIPVHTMAEGITIMDTENGIITNTAPNTVNQSVSTDKNINKNITLTGVDAENNLLTYSIVNNPLHGTITGNITTGSIVYTPNTDYVGTDGFSFKANDGKLDSNISTVSITINETAVTTTSDNNSNGGGNNGGGGGGGPIITSTNLSNTKYGGRKFNILDFNSIVVNWNKTGQGLNGDINIDGKIDLFDFNIILTNWNN